MPLPTLYAVVGDGNVRRNMTTLNNASRAAMASARVIDCQSFASFPQVLRELPNEVNGCIIQSVSCFLASAEDSGAVVSTVDPVLTDFAAQVRELCGRRPALAVFVAPPMFRTTPVWYRQGLPQIAHQFSNIMAADRPRNLHLLSSAVSNSLTADGIHLDPVAGLHYVLHLFDDAHRVISSVGAKG